MRFVQFYGPVLVRYLYDVPFATSRLFGGRGHPYYTALRRGMTTLRDRLTAVEDVDIDKDGRYKYVLIKVTASDAASGSEVSKNIVRGYSWADYHADIYDSVCQRVEPIGLDCECLGGGRILTKSSEGTIVVYGYSMGFGRADHQVTCDVIQKKYPNYKITWNNEGY